MIAVSISVLLLAGVAWAVMLDEVLCLLGTPGDRASRSWREFFAIGLWFGVTTAAVATWPRVCTLDLDPTAFGGNGGLSDQLRYYLLRLPRILPIFTTVTALGVTPAALLVRWRRSEPASAYVHVTAWVGLIGVLSLLFVHYIAYLDRFGNNPDFYYYICYARDTVALGKAHLSQYAYFPGPYFFWERVLHVTDGSLRSLQISGLLVILANSALTGVVVGRVTQSGFAGVFAAALHLALAERFESFGGTTEPLATLPFLGGLAVWGGLPFEGRRGAWRAIVFGILLGLTVFCKQQAGMLTLGFLALPVQKLWQPRGERHQWRLLMLVPIVAGITLLVAVLLRGEGLAPLKIGLASAAVGAPMPGANYQITSLPGAFRRFLHISVAADLLLLWTVACEVLLRIPGQGRPSADARVVDVWRVTLLSFAATLIQFRWKPYEHYGMLSMPCVVIVSVLSVVELYRHVMRVRSLAPVEQALWGSLAALPLLFACTAMLPGDFNPQRRPPAKLWHLSGIGPKTVAACRPFVTPGQDVLVIPRGLNALHFALGTRATSDPDGYAYLTPRERVSRVIRDANGPKVVLRYYPKINFLEDPDELIWTDDVLQSSGYRPQVVTEDCTVWLRE